MVKSIVSRKASPYQLILTGLDLVSSINGLLDCNLELKENPHVAKVVAMVSKWNEQFIDLVAKDGNI